MAEEKQMSEAEMKAYAEDLEARVKGFNAKLISLLAEFKLALGAVAFLAPDGRIGARPHVFDDKLVKEQPAPAVPTEAKSESGLEKVD